MGFDAVSRHRTWMPDDPRRLAVYRAQTGGRVTPKQARRARHKDNRAWRKAREVAARVVGGPGLAE